MRFVQAARLGVAGATLAIGAGGLLPTVPAAAADASVESIEQKLAHQRVRLNSLYDDAAFAAARFDAANHQLAVAEQAVEQERKALQKANARRVEWSDAVAALTVRQLQAGSGLQRLAAMLDSNGPRDLLERTAAFDIASEAMTANVDELSGRAAVHRATQRRLERARDEQQAAIGRLAADRNAINAAIARSKSATRGAEAERETLLRQLAEKQNRTVADVAAQQAAADPSVATAPVPATGTVPAPPPSPPQVPTEDGDAVWDRIAKCESGGNWHINTGNGYYGGLQFSKRTWHGIGGPGLPHEHSREVQIHYAKLLQARYGWGQWECAWARHG